MWERGKDGPRNLVLSLKIQHVLQPVLQYPGADLGTLMTSAQAAQADQGVPTGLLARSQHSINIY